FPAGARREELRGHAENASRLTSVDEGARHAHGREERRTCELVERECGCALESEVVLQTRRRILKPAGRRDVTCRITGAASAGEGDGRRSAIEQGVDARRRDGMLLE